MRFRSAVKPARPGGSFASGNWYTRFPVAVLMVSKSETNWEARGYIPRSGRVGSFTWPTRAWVARNPQHTATSRSDLIICRFVKVLPSWSFMVLRQSKRGIRSLGGGNCRVDGEREDLLSVFDSRDRGWKRFPSGLGPSPMDDLHLHRG